MQRTHPSRRQFLGALAAAGLLLALLAPKVLSNYTTNMLVLVFSSAALSQSWNVLGGYAGQMSLGHAAFFGVGAYTSTLLLVRLAVTPWLGMLAGGLLAVALGLFVGYLAFRYGIRGVYFVLITLAFAEGLRVIDSNWDFTGGASGLLLPTVLEDSWWKMQFASVAPYYYVSLGLMLALTIGVALIARSPLGLFFAAIRENEDAAAALGVNLLRYKLIAMAISAFMAATAGTFYAQYINFIDPGTTFSIEVSLQAILSAVVGGMGTVAGPVVGSFVLTPLSQLVERVVGAYRGLQTIIYGFLLIGIVLLAPGGLWPVLRTWVVTPLLNLLLPGPPEDPRRRPAPSTPPVAPVEQP